MNLSNLFEKAVNSAKTAYEFAAKTANTAGKKAEVVYNKSKHNLSIFDLNGELDVLYKELGKLIYAAHKGEENTDAVTEKIESIDAKLAEVEALRDKIDELRDWKECTACGFKAEKDAQYCKKCGTKL